MTMKTRHTLLAALLLVPLSAVHSTAESPQTAKTEHPDVWSIEARVTTSCLSPLTI